MILNTVNQTKITGVYYRSITYMGNIKHFTATCIRSPLFIKPGENNSKVYRSTKNYCKLVDLPEVGKAQLEVQPPQLRKLHCALIFYFETLRKLCCGLKSLKLIVLHFQFFLLIVQFYSMNLILFHFNRNIDKCRLF